KRRGKIALAGACGPHQDDIVMCFEPAKPRELLERGPVEATLGVNDDILERRPFRELRLFEALRQPAILPRQPLLVDDEPEPLLPAQLDLRFLSLHLAHGERHVAKTERGKFFARWL